MNTGNSIPPDLHGSSRQVFAHWDLVNMLARKRFREEYLVLESVNFVLERLQENNWERVRKHTGSGSMKAYLNRVIQRLLHDFARKKFGRKQQPKWLDAQPPFWKKVHRLLCLERFSVQDVMQLLGEEVPGGRTDSSLREAITVIRTKDRDCGRSLTITESVSLQDVPEPSVKGTNGDELARHCDLVEMVYRHLTDKEPDAPEATPLTAAAQVLSGDLVLESEERLLLRMIFEDGMKVTQAGRMLGLSAHAIHGQLRRLLARIKAAMEQSALADALREALEER
jgi:RNA polymerase sigma factor (sigma-70 family)